MAWKRTVLVVANVTATSDELLQALKARAEKGPAAFTFVVPATPFGGGRAAATNTLSAASERLRDAGLEVDGTVGDGDPVIAVSEAWDPKRYDEIIVSTLPVRMSKWLHAGLPERIAKITGAPVTHVIAQPPKPAVETAPAPAREKPGGVMTPLSVLGWGRQKRD
jgi:GABA permease